SQILGQTRVRDCDVAHSGVQRSFSASARTCRGLRRYRSAAMSKVRLDSLLADRGIFASRARAAASVMAGEVRLGAQGERAIKPGQIVADDVDISVDETPLFVSRGGIKLQNALDGLGLDVSGRHCLDVGASTGGFTD